MRCRPLTGARLYRHGDTVSDRAALELVALPAYPKDWAILPSPDGDTLTLTWGNACTLEELGRADDWNRAQLAQLEAARLPAGRA